jgi:hypothetical protein
VHLLLRLDLSDFVEHHNGAERVCQLHELLAPCDGEGVRLRLHYRRPGCEGRLRCADTWSVNPADALLERLAALLGDETVQVIYERVYAAPPTLPPVHRMGTP